MSFKRQELLTHREDLGSLPEFDGVRVDYSFSFLCCVLLCVVFCFALFFISSPCVLCPVLSVYLDCQIMSVSVSKWSNHDCQ